MTEESRDLVPVALEKMDLVSPLDAETILAAFRKFEWLMQNVVGPGDRVKVGDRSFVKKSGCLKIALSCNMSLEKREERVEKDGDEIIYHYTFRAVAPSGRFADADGSASSFERTFSHVPHDIRALAQTRACNRAILNLAGAGGGTVSFEEMDAEPETESPKQEGAANTDLDEDGIIDALESIGLDADELEISIDLEGVAMVKPKKFLGDIWDRYNNALWKLGFSWVSAKKESHWKRE